MRSAAALPSEMPARYIGRPMTIQVLPLYL